MKLILSLALICMLSGTAGADTGLMCIQCTNPNDLTCTFGQPVECDSGDVCLNAFITASDGTMRIYRDCASTTVCPNLGMMSIEANTGGQSSITMANCCNTDGCNNVPITFAAVSSPNGRSCPGSSAPSALLFDPVLCVGSEDTCFSGSALVGGNQITLGGCGSSNVCDIAGDLQALPFIDGGFIPTTPVCTAVPTTTPEPTTTTTGPTTTTTEPPTTTTEPPTTTTEPPTTTTEPPTTTTEPTTVYTPSTALLARLRVLFVQLKLVSASINLQLLLQNQVAIFQLHLQLLDYQQNLLLQQEGLPIDDHQQLPLYYQQCLMVHHQQLLLHQIHISLCGQQELMQLFYRHQCILREIQEVLYSHHHNLMPYYQSYLLYYHNGYHPTTTEEPTTTTEEPTTTTEEPTTTTEEPTTNIWP